MQLTTHTPSDSGEPSTAAPKAQRESRLVSLATPLLDLMISEDIARRRNVTGCPPSLACSRLLSELFLCWRATAANSPAANRSDGRPYQLDRAEDRGDHDHDRRGDAHSQNVIQHVRLEWAFSPFSLSGAGAQE